MGQYFQNRALQETSHLEEITQARRETAKSEKDLNAKLHAAVDSGKKTRNIPAFYDLF